MKYQKLIAAIRSESSSRFTVARVIAKTWKTDENGRRAKSDWIDDIQPVLAANGADFGYDKARQAAEIDRPQAG